MHARVFVAARTMLMTTALAQLILGITSFLLILVIATEKYGALNH